MSKEIDVYVPGLPSTPGWTTLSPEKQEWLKQKTSNVMQFRRMGAVAGLGECKELLDVEKGLEQEKMTMTNYMRVVYQKHERTGWRKLADYKALVKVWPDIAIETLMSKGAELLHGSTGIGTKHLLQVAKTLPAPKTNDAKVIEAFIEKDVRSKLREERRRQAKGSELTEDEATKVIVITATRALRQSGVSDSRGQRKILETSVGMVMQRRAITGTVTAVRTLIPDGFLPPRGRPRKNMDEDE